MQTIQNECSTLSWTRSSLIVMHRMFTVEGMQIVLLSWLWADKLPPSIFVVHNTYLHDRFKCDANTFLPNEGLHMGIDGTNVLPGMLSCFPMLTELNLACKIVVVILAVFSQASSEWTTSKKKAACLRETGAVSLIEALSYRHSPRLRYLNVAGIQKSVVNSKYYEMHILGLSANPQHNTHDTILNQVQTLTLKFSKWGTMRTYWFWILAYR